MRARLMLRLKRGMARVKGCAKWVDPCRPLAEVGPTCASGGLLLRGRYTLAPFTQAQLPFIADPFHPHTTAALSTIHCMYCCRALGCGCMHAGASRCPSPPEGGRGVSCPGDPGPCPRSSSCAAVCSSCRGRRSCRWTTTHGPHQPYVCPAVGCGVGVLCTSRTTALSTAGCGVGSVYRPRARSAAWGEVSLSAVRTLFSGVWCAAPCASHAYAMRWGLSA